MGQTLGIEDVQHGAAELAVRHARIVPRFARPEPRQRALAYLHRRIENCQIGVFLAYTSQHGRAFLDRELYLPQSWTEDTARRAEAGVPAEIGFRTKPELARVMLE